MAFLTPEELKSTYYKQGAYVDDKDLTTYLQRANAYCRGEIGGDPPTVDEGLKIAVAMAFEVFAKGETAQVDEFTGNITEAAPAGYFARKADDPFVAVKAMLRPYKLAFESASVIQSERRVLFL